MDYSNITAINLNYIFIYFYIKNDFNKLCRLWKLFLNSLPTNSPEFDNKI